MDDGAFSDVTCSYLRVKNVLFLKTKNWVCAFMLFLFLIVLIGFFLSERRKKIRNNVVFCRK